jgi:outer membrane biosynthesis protein TonB
MFHTLVASGPQARPSARRFLLSLSVHGVAIAGAIASSRPAATTAPQTHPALVFFAPQPRQRSLRAVSDRVGAQVAPTPSWEPLLQIPDLIPPVLPTTLPGIADLLDTAFLRAGSSPALPGSPASGMGEDKTWTVDSVDVPVEVIEQPPVRYPPALAQADIAGLVELEYVVDTAGRAEPGSLRTLAAAHPEFEAAARATVLGSHFRPARLHRQAVRQLVRQTFRFRSER